MSAIVVVGGATGIGRASVERLRAGGHDVHLADLQAENAADVIAELGHLPGVGSSSWCDLAQPDGPAAAIDAAVAALGQIDALVVCAGYLFEAELDAFPTDAWDRTLAVNLTAPFRLTQLAAPHLRRSSTGRVVLTGSTAAFRGNAGSFAYAASKGGLVALTRSLAIALGPDRVCVNCLCPGWIDTPFNDSYWDRVGRDDATLADIETRIPIGAQGEPADVAAVVEFLVSPGARYITGQAIVVDGGLLAS